jgi:hypothetical protein
MVAEGKTTLEISERLAALAHVLLDWSEQKIEMPNGKTPWEWDQADLEQSFQLPQRRCLPFPYIWLHASTAYGRIRFVPVVLKGAAGK